jgi:hypothetical protein
LNFAQHHHWLIGLNFTKIFSEIPPKLRRQGTPYHASEPSSGSSSSSNHLDPDYELLLNEYQRIRGPHSLFVGTWNVANGPFAASEPLQDWLPPNMVRDIHESR